MRHTAAPGALLGACLLALALALPARAHEGGFEEIIDCSLRNLPPAAHGRVVLIARDASGAERRIEADYWSRQPELGARRVVIAARGAPGGEAQAYLFSDGLGIGESWEWAKERGAPRRVEANGARLFGTNVTFEDFARVVRINLPGQLRLHPEAKVGDRPVYVVEYRHGDDEHSDYDRIVTSIDKELCLVLRRECYQDGFEHGARPRKLYTVDPADVVREGGIALPKRAQLVDQRDGSSTRMEIVSMDLAPKVGDEFFEPEALPRAAR